MTSKSTIQKNLIRHILRNKDFVDAIPAKYIKMLRSYLITDLSIRELGKEYNVSPAAFEEICKTAGDTLIFKAKKFADERNDRQKSQKALILEREKYEKEREEFELHLKLKRTQATAENPDIRTIGFSERLTNLLKRTELVLLKDLSQITEKDFLRFRNAGVKSLEEAKKKMKEYNFFFKGSSPNSY
jgi:DNA-directed RNA polymerase alpha subunit